MTAAVKPEVWVVVYSHRHGIDVNVHTTEQGAIAALADLCRFYWDDALAYATVENPVPSDPGSLSGDRQVIDVYFAAVADESWEITLKTVAGPAVKVGGGS